MDFDLINIIVFCVFMLVPFTLIAVSRKETGERINTDDWIFSFSAIACFIFNSTVVERAIAELTISTFYNLEIISNIYIAIQSIILVGYFIFAVKQFCSIFHNNKTNKSNN